MIIYKTIKSTEEVIKSIKCDKCGHLTKDKLEMQEFYHFNFYASYGAKYFSDNDLILADICEKCLFEMIKDFARIN